MYKTLIIFLFFPLFLSSKVYPLSNFTPYESIDTYYKRGYRFLKEKKYKTSYYNFSMVLKLSSNKMKNEKYSLNSMKKIVGSLVGRCYSALELGNFDSVIKDTSLLIQYKAKNYNIHYLRAKAFINKKAYRLALKDLTDAIKLNPNNLNLYYEKATTLYLLKKYKEALIDYTKVLEKYPKSYKALINRGNCYGRLKEFDNAIKDYQMALKIDKSSTPFYNIACIFSLKNNSESACSYLKKAIKYGIVEIDDIKNDSDFDNIKNSPCYLKIIEKLR